MSAIIGSSEYGDVLDDVYVQAVKTVSTSAVQLVVASSPNIDREVVRIYNKGNQTIYLGPTSGVTSANGEPLFKDQWIEYPFGPNLTIYGITASSSSDVVIAEMG